MKKHLGKLMGLGLATMMCMNVMAATKIGVNYNGKAMTLAQEPKVIQNSILLPIRTISEELGYTVLWQQGTGKISISNGTDSVQLEIGKKSATVNGKAATLLVAPQVISDTTYVPLRFVGEALNLNVEWDSNKKCANLSDASQSTTGTTNQANTSAAQYTVDKANKKLMMTTSSGKTILADITTLEGDATVVPSVSCKKTKYGNDLVEVSETISGALTGNTSTVFYIKDGKVIDKNERELFYTCEQGIAYYENEIAFCTGRYLRIYDDQTGNLIQKYDLNELKQAEFGLDLMKLGKNFAMGRSNNTLHIVDFKSGAITRVLDYVPEADQFSVYQDDLYLATDNIKLVWETEDALVFKYYSETEKQDKTITYKIGQGMLS